MDGLACQLCKGSVHIIFIARTAKKSIMDRSSKYGCSYLCYYVGMSRVKFFNIYKLKKGVSASEFLVAARKLDQEYISKQKGYVSFEVMVDGDVYADCTVFETMEDAREFAGCAEPNGLAEKFYAFINLSSCRSNFFLVTGD